MFRLAQNTLFILKRETCPLWLLAFLHFCLLAPAKIENKNSQMKLFFFWWYVRWDGWVGWMGEEWYWHSSPLPTRSLLSLSTSSIFTCHRGEENCDRSVETSEIVEGVVVFRFLLYVREKHLFLRPLPAKTPEAAVFAVTFQSGCCCCSCYLLVKNKSDSAVSLCSNVYGSATLTNVTFSFETS